MIERFAMLRGMQNLSLELILAAGLIKSTSRAAIVELGCRSTHHPWEPRHIGCATAHTDSKDDMVNIKDTTGITSVYGNCPFTAILLLHVDDFGIRPHV